MKSDAGPPRLRRRRTPGGLGIGLDFRRRESLHARSAEPTAFASGRRARWRGRTGERSVSDDGNGEGKEVGQGRRRSRSCAEAGKAMPTKEVVAAALAD